VEREMSNENAEETEKILITLFKERQKIAERIEVAYKLKAFMKKEAINDAYFRELENHIMDGVKTEDGLRNLQKVWEDELLKEYWAKEYYEYNRGTVRSITCGTKMTDDEIRSAIRYAYFQYYVDTFLGELERMYCALNDRPYPLPIDYDEMAKREKTIDEKVKSDAEVFWNF